MKVNTALEAVSLIQSNQRVFLHGGAATPNVLIDALVKRASELENVELIHLHTIGPAGYASEKLSKAFRVANLFIGPNMRRQLDYDRVDYLPCFLSEIPQLFKSRRRPIDVALVHLSEPDRHGHCTLGASVDIAKAAVDAAEIVIAQVNKQMPHTHGDGFTHLKHLDRWIEIDEPLPQGHNSKLSPEELEIGRHAAQLIEDGSTLQMGIGSIPDAVLASLTHHRHLGIHSEMWSDGALKLIKSGAVDNSRKAVHPGKTVGAFVIGSSELYDFIDDNPSVVMLVANYVNNPVVISRNRKVVAINSAVEIDLTGQVCADSVGPRMISGVGGQMDFMRGAAISEGGKPIIAITSRTKDGKSKITPMLRQGAGVVTTRSHVHWVITEYGVTNLFGKTLNERAKALIDLAHPEDREGLKKAWAELKKKIFNPAQLD